MEVLKGGQPPGKGRPATSRVATRYGFCYAHVHVHSSVRLAFLECDGLDTAPEKLLFHVFLKFRVERHTCEIDAAFDAKDQENMVP